MILMRWYMGSTINGSGRREATNNNVWPSLAVQHYGTKRRLTAMRKKIYTVLWRKWETFGRDHWKD